VFGASAAIVLGDLLLSWADAMFSAAGLAIANLPRTRLVWDEMRQLVMAGQYLDVLVQARGDFSAEDALRVAKYKTSKYTVEGPLHLGAAAAGASHEVVAVLSDYGLPLGEAFQLRDDVLGVFGDPAETGKPAGDDIREGKRTLLIAKALARATEAEAALVESHLGNPQLGPAGVDAVREVISTSGALAETEKLIGELTDRALTALHSDLIDPRAADVLRELAVAATARRV
jgi:geranylgeranyl diphosphate synthase type I